MQVFYFQVPILIKLAPTLLLLLNMLAQSKLVIVFKLVVRLKDAEIILFGLQIGTLMQIMD